MTHNQAHKTYILGSRLVHLIMVEHLPGSSLVKVPPCDVHEKCTVTFCQMHVSNGRLTRDEVTCMGCVIADMEPPTREISEEIEELQKA